MSKEVVVFTKRPEDGVCPGCKMLKRKLDAEGILTRKSLMILTMKSM